MIRISRTEAAALQLLAARVCEPLCEVDSPFVEPGWQRVIGAGCDTGPSVSSVIAQPLNKRRRQTTTPRTDMVDYPQQSAVGQDTSEARVERSRATSSGV